MSPSKKLPKWETAISAPVTLGEEVREMIRSARQQVAQVVNAGLTLLHWRIGDRIRREILRGERAEYGAEVVAALSRDLQAEFGRGFGPRNLFNMIRFAEVFPDPETVQSLIAQLGWTHFLHLISIEDPLKRDFYAEMCRVERWSTRTLAAKIQSMLYERTALSRKPDKVIRQELDELRSEGALTPSSSSRTLTCSISSDWRTTTANATSRRRSCERSSASFSSSARASHSSSDRSASRSTETTTTWISSSSTGGCGASS